MIRFRGIEIDNKRRSITHNGVAVHGISKVKWRYLMHLILGGGLTAEEIFDKIYGHRADGGPLSGWERVRVMVHHSMLKKMYERLGLKRYRTRDGEAHTRYELIPEQDERGCR